MGSVHKEISEVLYDLNAIDKSFIFHLMATVQLPCGERFDTHMEVHTETQNTDMILAKAFQKYFFNSS